MNPFTILLFWKSPTKRELSINLAFSALYLLVADSVAPQMVFELMEGGIRPIILQVVSPEDKPVPSLF